ncbi:hypothetical protein MSTE_01518 [Mycobacteroides stephanolepidis]|uniref:Uncharacterized protein n=1 Tax=[Mycobacterium] stephanolepidis TaxID=1520670 RepID=A0A1Z4EV66_9MYCO|nr:hypothetical protein MSTE_01518 [[Mycobacterium] stephanolepidis]
MKYERLFLDEISDPLALAERTEHWHAEYNHPQASRGTELEPAHGSAPGAARPHHPHL